MSEIYVAEARQKDLENLVTILPRSFHPVNPYQRKAQPDTPAIRQWWHRVFEDEINDPRCHPLAAIDSATDKDVGILTLRLLGPDDESAGFWSIYPWTKDHESEMCDAFTDVMVDWKKSIMKGQRHYLIELFGVDHAVKAKGTGRKLIERALEITDKEGVEVFVQANASARGFYEKFGFVCEKEVMCNLKGMEYGEFMMVRRQPKHE